MCERAIGTDERRRRLAWRHHLAGEARAGDVVAAAEGLVGLHATDPATVYLSGWARVAAFTPDRMDAALYAERTLVKQLAMRRTLFVVGREDLALVRPAAGERVAAAERARLVKDVEAAGLQADGARWLVAAEAAVLAALAGGRHASATELREELPVLAGQIAYGAGKSWGGSVPVAPRVLTVLSAAGRVVRGPNAGHWAVSRPRWTLMESWLSGPLDEPPVADATTRLVGRWLHAYGPGTEDDIVWWLGGTRTAVRAALAALGAVPVDLGGRRGWLAPDDLAAADPVDPWAALLPALDPTTMGWKERDWYLGPHRAQLFDTAGNAGPTVWWDGHIVGGWRQDDDGAVVVQLLEDVGADARARIDAEAERLGAWLGGRRVLPRFPSPLFRGRTT